MKVEGVGFDYGNTLVLDPFDRVMGIRSTEFRNILKENGYDLPAKEIIDAWNDVNLSMNYPFCSHFAQEIPLVKTALEKLGVKKADRSITAQQLLAAYRSGLRQVLMNDGRIAKVKDVLSELKSRGKKLVMLSNERVDTLRSQLKWTGLGEFFEEIIISEKVGVEKPDEKIFRFMVRLFDLPKDKIVYIGDDPVRDVKPAKLFGLKTIWLKHPEARSVKGWRDYGLELRDEEKPDVVSGNLEDLTRIIE